MSLRIFGHSAQSGVMSARTARAVRRTRNPAARAARSRLAMIRTKVDISRTVASKATGIQSSSRCPAR